MPVQTVPTKDETIDENRGKIKETVAMLEKEYTKSKTPSSLKSVLRTPLFPGKVANFFRNNGLFGLKSSYKTFESMVAEDESGSYKMKKTDAAKDAQARGIRFYTNNGNLFTYEFTPKVLDAIEQKKANHVIYIPGNGGSCAEFMADAVKHAEDGRVVRLYDHPGVGFSDGSVDSARDFIRGVIDQVHDLLSQGIPPINITLYGHSMGGTAAILAARVLKNNGIEVKVVADRTFCSTTKVGVKTSGILNLLGEDKTRSLMKALDFDMQTQEALDGREGEKELQDAVVVGVYGDKTIPVEKEAGLKPKNGVHHIFRLAQETWWSKFTNTHKSKPCELVADVEGERITLHEFAGRHIDTKITSSPTPR